MTTAVEWAGRR